MFSHHDLTSMSPLSRHYYVTNSSRPGAAKVNGWTLLHSISPVSHQCLASISPVSCHYQLTDISPVSHQHLTSISPVSGASPSCCALAFWTSVAIRSTLHARVGTERDGRGWMGNGRGDIMMRCGSDVGRKRRRGRGGERVDRQGVGNQRHGADKVGEECEVEAVCSPPPLCAAAAHRPKQFLLPQPPSQRRERGTAMQAIRPEWA